MATQQLHRRAADARGMLSAEHPRPPGMLVEIRTLIGPRTGPPEQKAHALQLDGHVGDAEGHRLWGADRLAEGLALVAVGNRVVQRRLGGAARQRAPAQGAESEGGAVMEALPAQAGGPFHLPITQAGARGGAGAQAHGRFRSALDPWRIGRYPEQRRPVAALGGNNQLLRLAALQHQAFLAVEAV